MNKRIVKKVEKRRRDKIHELLDLTLDINSIMPRKQEETGNKPTAFLEVSRIAYDTDRNIIDLVIVDKKGKTVFSINRVDENGNKPDDPPMLEEKYVNSLFLELKRTGVGLKGLLQTYNVSDIHELRFEQWKSAMDQLKTKPDKV